MCKSVMALIQVLICLWTNIPRAVGVRALARVHTGGGSGRGSGLRIFKVKYCLQGWTLTCTTSLIKVSQLVNCIVYPLYYDVMLQFVLNKLKRKYAPLSLANTMWTHTAPSQPVGGGDTTTTKPRKVSGCNTPKPIEQDCPHATNLAHSPNTSSRSRIDCTSQHGF